MSYHCFIATDNYYSTKLNLKKLNRNKYRLTVNCCKNSIAILISISFNHLININLTLPNKIQYKLDCRYRFIKNTFKSIKNIPNTSNTYTI